MKTRTVELVGNELDEDLAVLPTLANIIAQAKEEDVPEHATLSYQGEGSHWVEWVWQEQMTPEEEAWHIELDRAALAREEEARDRRERRKGLPIIDDERLGF
jgi:hypothetical protein